MTDRLPAPSLRVATLRHAHIETERGAAFVALVDRLVAREAERDRVTGLTAEEAAIEQFYRAHPVPHRRVESPHNPLIGAQRISA